MDKARKRHASQRGMTLMEAIVATAIFTVVFLTALALYDVANRTYLSTDAATIQQQNVRFALDRVTETLRDAGANYNTLGAKNLADEQIEGAWEAAVFVRGDFDNARENCTSATAGCGPTVLESATFPIVAVGNDEIVGYVLRKNGAGALSISVKLDTSGPRDAIFTSDSSITNEETKTINVAATTLAQQTDPPYELTRVTFKPDGTPKYEVVADNVFRMSFQYFDEDNAALAAYPAGLDSERDERRTIRRIGVNLIGLADRPDGNYVDPNTYTPAESAATKHYRKFSLSQSVLSTNMGITGHRHMAVPALALAAPASITTCAGHCRNYHVSWPSVTGVTTYKVLITAPASGPAPAFTFEAITSGLEYEFEEPAVDITNSLSRTFTFKVAAFAAGETGTFTSGVSKSSFNDSPSVPSDVTGVMAYKAAAGNAMAVEWTAVTTNTGTVTATSNCVSSAAGSAAPPAPWNGAAVDLANYKVYRVRSDGLATGDDATTDVSSAALGSLANVPTSGNTFIDNLAAPCSSYYYRVKATDMCAIESTGFSTAMSTPSSFTIDPGVVPSKPAAPAPVSSVGFDGTTYTVQLGWAPVVRTAAGEAAATAHYRLLRYRKLGTDPWTAPPSPPESAGGASFDLYDTLTGPSESLPAVVGGRTANYRYYVQAVYDCADTRASAYSDPYDLACTPPPSNTVAITTPATGATFSRPFETSSAIQLTTTGSGWTAGQVQIFDSGGAVVYNQPGTIGAGVISFPAWNLGALPDDTYTIKATATVGACQASASDVVVILNTAACGMNIVSPVSTGSPPNTETEFKIQNTCDDVVHTINAMTPSWTNTPAATRLIKVRFGTTVLYDNATGVASGTKINFTSNVTLNVGPTPTTLWEFTYNDNFTNNGNTNGSGANPIGDINSIIVHTTSGAADEIVDSPPIP